MAINDPVGDQRRQGLRQDAVPVAESTDGQGSVWTHKTATEAYRICRQRGLLYRKDWSSEFYGGHRIMTVPLVGRGLRIAHEWLHGKVGTLQA
jgi:hypothetical protein